MLCHYGVHVPYIDGVRQCCASMYANRSERECTRYAQYVGTGSCTILFGGSGDPFSFTRIASRAARYAAWVGRIWSGYSQAAEWALVEAGAIHCWVSRLVVGSDPQVSKMEVAKVSQPVHED
jgi:hypothetical protein